MRIFLILFLILICSCNKKETSPLEKVLISSNSKIKNVMDSIENHEVQIIYTEVLRKDSAISFKEYSFQKDDERYFYPASTVKFPIALLALEKLKEEGLHSRNTKFYVEGDSIETTFENEIKKIFAVSDNDAYNRLFEYLGQDKINQRLKEKGVKSRISHRLSTPNSDVLTTTPLIFYLNDSTTTTSVEIVNSELVPLQLISPFQLRDIAKGVGYMEGDSLIAKPKDFAYKNYLPISSLHQLMKQFIFPQLYPKEKQFNLSKSDRDFVLNSMKMLPKDAGYQSEAYYDSYVKFFLFGDSKEAIPNTIEIYNKVGYAYGYLTDCAYIVNKDTGKEYIITATIHVNKNGIFNDDQYEYETIGIPFLAELGRQLVLH